VPTVVLFWVERCGELDRPPDPTERCAIPSSPRSVAQVEAVIQVLHRIQTATDKARRPEWIGGHDHLGTTPCRDSDAGVGTANFCPAIQPIQRANDVNVNCFERGLFVALWRGAKLDWVQGCTCDFFVCSVRVGLAGML
jgi:hypothetical protein